MKCLLFVVCGLLLFVCCLAFGVGCIDALKYFIIVYDIFLFQSGHKHSKINFNLQMLLCRLFLKPPSPTLPPKGEGSLSIVSFKIFTVDNFNYFVRLKLPPWGIEGTTF